MLKNIIVDYIQSCKINQEDLSATGLKINAEINRIVNAHNTEYKTDYASINLPFDKKNSEHSALLAAQKLSLKPTLLIVIGIGGSNLGTMAILQSLRGVFYNNYHHIKTYFADTVDPDYTHEIILLAEKELSAGNSIILNVISKSGSTTETIAHAQLFFNILKKYHPYDYNKYVVITTDKHSPLEVFAQQNTIDFLTIPAKVGGRYSVFSTVGLFPLALLGIDITQLLAGAQSAFELCTHKNYTENPATISAIIMHLLYKKGYVIHNSFLFCPALENVGKWYRQLMAESIGKTYDNNNNIVHNGILPIVSIGSTDLHSVAQLYLSGPYNIYTTFISIEKNNNDFSLPHDDTLATIAPTIQQKTFTTIMNAILQGTKTAYEKDNRPFTSCIIPEKNAYFIGEFMQIKMYEIMYLSFLMDINPFDQPQVELYKQETKKILKQKQ